MESLNQIHFLYQYSLQFFLDVFSGVLGSKKLADVKDYAQRLKIITSELFQSTYLRVARGMFHQDRIIFALLMSRIHLKQSASESVYEVEFQHMMRGQEAIVGEKSRMEIPGLDEDQIQALVRLAKLPNFRDIAKKIQNNPEFTAWLESATAELNVPKVWNEPKPLSDVGTTVHNMLMVQTFRPDRYLAASHLFVDSVLSHTFMAEAEQVMNMADVVENEVKASVPILMCSVAGYDASSHVEDLAAECNKQITGIAIGSAEGFALADKAINSASKTGRWVMLKNVHLAPQWLVQLEKKLHSLTPHASFRLFLTMEINPKLPVNLLRAGRVFVFEPPPGVKANLLRTFSTVPTGRMNKVPNERSRMYFLLAWLHAIIQERLTYSPLGWSKKYEFNESDLRCACDTLDIWIDTVAMGRTNLPPEKVPWDALRTLLSQCIYGGKIDNEFDQRLLTAFVNKLFTEKSFDADFPLVVSKETKNIIMPEGIRREQFVHWSENMPDTQTPSWLGLPNNAEKVLLTTLGGAVITKLLKMQMLEDDDELAYSSSGKSDEDEEAAKAKALQDGRPAWMRTLNNSLATWMKLVPKDIVAMKRTIENIKDPLFRFFEREVNAGAKMLVDVRRDMNEVMQICEGTKKPTNHHRQLMSELAKGMIPSSWRRYTIPAGLTVIQWVTDFSSRIKQLQNVSAASQAGGPKALKNLNIWLGGLFIPEAYITATRQYVAQANNWSLEELYLDVIVYENPKDVKLDECSFGSTGLRLQGAECKNNTLSLSTTISTELPVATLRWIRHDSVQPSQTRVTLPVYLNATRAQLLFTVDFETAGDGSGKDHSFYERGVALISSTLGS